VKSDLNKEIRRMQLINYFLWWNVERDGTQIDFGVSVDAWNDEEDAGASSSSGYQATEAEDDGTLVFLYNLRRTERSVTVVMDEGREAVNSDFDVLDWVSGRVRLTLMQKKREKGKLHTMSAREITVKSTAQRAGSSTMSAVKGRKDN
jgi:hypothetical protein